MPKKMKLMKKLAWLNLILLELIFIFSYRNLRLDLEGICSECAADTHFLIEVGTIMLATQVIIAMIMYHVFNNDNNIITIVVNMLLGSIGAVISFFQIFCFVGVRGVGHEKPSPKDEVEVMMIDIQFDFIQIVSIIMILVYVSLIILSLYNLFLIKNGVVEKYMYNVDLENTELNKNEIISVSKPTKVIMNVNLCLIVLIAIEFFIVWGLDFAVFAFEYMYLTPMVLTTYFLNKHMKEDKVKMTIVMYAILLFVSYRIINTCMELEEYGNVHIIGLLLTCITYIFYRSQRRTKKDVDIREKI